MYISEEKISPGLTPLQVYGKMPIIGEKVTVTSSGKKKTGTCKQVSMAGRWFMLEIPYSSYNLRSGSYMECFNLDDISRKN